MRTNIEIDDRLIRASSTRMKRDAIEAGLRLLKETYGQAEVLRRLRGKVQWEGDLESLVWA